MIVGRPSETREALGFLAGTVAAAGVLALIALLLPGFAASRMTAVLGVVMLLIVPGTVLIGLPVYYAIRRTRTPGLGWTVAFGAAACAAPAVLLALADIGPREIPAADRTMIHGIVGAAAALGGAVSGLVFWTLVFKAPRDRSA